MSVLPESAAPTLVQRLIAEALGTFLLVFGVIGTAVLAAGFASGEQGLSVGFLGVAVALGLSVLVAAFAFGPVSGGHFNPAVTLGLATARRFAWADVLGYVIAQLVGGVLATTVLLGIVSTAPGSDGTAFRGASAGWGVLSPGGFGLLPVLLVEVVTTAVLVIVILAVTGLRGVGALAPFAIGATLTVLALVAIPVSNASFNPARSIATAVYGGPEALAQLWATIVAPIAGAMLAGLVFRSVFERPVRLVEPAAPAARVGSAA